MEINNVSYFKEFKNARFIKLEFFNMFLTLGINGNDFVSYVKYYYIYTLCRNFLPIVDFSY